MVASFVIVVHVHGHLKLCLCCLPIAVSELATSYWALRGSFWATLVFLTGSFPRADCLPITREVLSGVECLFCPLV